MTTNHPQPEVMVTWRRAGCRCPLLFVVLDLDGWVVTVPAPERAQKTELSLRAGTLPVEVVGDGPESDVFAAAAAIRDADRWTRGVVEMVFPLDESEWGARVGPALALTLGCGHMPWRGVRTDVPVIDLVADVRRVRSTGQRVVRTIAAA